MTKNSLSSVSETVLYSARFQNKAGKVKDKTRNEDQGLIQRKNLHGHRYGETRSNESTPIVFALFHVLSLVFDRFALFRGFSN